MNESVRAFYDAAPEREWQRVETGLSRIEFASTLRLIDKYFPPEGAVCDIGGGPGRYALELARRGYATTLLDLSERLLERAKKAFDAEGLRAPQFIHGDAQDLGSFADASFDAALLLGPMYHLIDGAARDRALRELHRVLKPGGRAIVAFLNAWGLMRSGVVDFPQRFRDIGFLRGMLAGKTFRGELAGFTHCHWSTPEIADGELRKAGLRVVSRAGAESFAGGMTALLEKLAEDEPDAYVNVVQVAAETAESPPFRDATDHLHFVVEKGEELDVRELKGILPKPEKSASLEDMDRAVGGGRV